MQEHISKFGGDPNRVTVYGVSAGAGSILLHAVAQNTSMDTNLFKNVSFEIQLRKQCPFSVNQEVEG